MNLVTGDFETGDLSGWNTFTTASGTSGVEEGLPGVTLYDTNNDGTVSNSATFNVGFDGDSSGVHSGGGIFQEFITDAGRLIISVDIASHTMSIPNLSGGVFYLLLDGSVVDVHDFGTISPGKDEFATLTSKSVVTAGTHEIRILITRPYTYLPRDLRQYVDNVELSGIAAPPLQAR